MPLFTLKIVMGSIEKTKTQPGEEIGQEPWWPGSPPIVQIRSLQNISTSMCRMLTSIDPQIIRQNVEYARTRYREECKIQITKYIFKVGSQNIRKRDYMPIARWIVGIRKLKPRQCWPDKSGWVRSKKWKTKTNIGEAKRSKTATLESRSNSIVETIFQP